MKNVRGNSGTNKLADIGARGFATTTSNEYAAAQLYTGAKSEPVPIHDSMAGYDGAAPATPGPQDNIRTLGKNLGYAE